MAKGLSAAKAKKILTDGYVKGKPLTAKQRKYFGAIASGATPLKAINGGWLDKYEDGRDVEKAQDGTEVEETLTVESKDDPRYKAYQDSLEVYNDYKKVQKSLLKNNYKLERHSVSNPDYLAMKKKMLKEKGIDASNWDGEGANILTKRGSKAFEALENLKPKYVKHINKDKYKVLDLQDDMVNTNLPMQLFNKNIDPIGVTEYIDKDKYWTGTSPDNYEFNGTGNLYNVGLNIMGGSQDVRSVFNYSNAKPRQKVVVEQNSQKDRIETKLPPSKETPKRPIEEPLSQLDSYGIEPFKPNLELLTSGDIEAQPIYQHKPYNQNDKPIPLGLLQKMGIENPESQGFHYIKELNGNFKTMQTREAYRKDNLRPNNTEYKNGGGVPKAQGGKALKWFKDMYDGAKKFDSSIDWRKWVKYTEDFDNNPDVIKHLNEIEKTTKGNGTWMKNPDGSAFKGTQEEFVVQQSDNYKKAFPNPVVDDAGNIQMNYHGSPNEFTEFDPNKFYSGSYGRGVYTSPDKELILKSYANPDKKRVDKIRKLTNKKAIDNTDKTHLYELYINSKNPKNYDDILDYGDHVGNIKNFGKTVDDVPSLQDFRNSIEGNDWLKELSDEKLLNYIESSRISPVKENFTPVLEGVDFLNVPSTRLKEQVTPFSNRLKSAKGNILFDMTNPNIYKAIVPGAIGAGAVSQMGPKQEDGQFKNGGWLDKYEDGGDVEKAQMGKIITQAQNAGEDVQNAQQDVQNRAVIFAEAPEYRTHQYNIGTPIYDSKGNLIANYPSELETLYNNYNQSEAGIEDINNKKIAEKKASSYLQFLIHERGKMKDQQAAMWKEWEKMHDPKNPAEPNKLLKFEEKYKNLGDQIVQFKKQINKRERDIDKKYNPQLDELYLKNSNAYTDFYNNERNSQINSTDSTFYKEAQNLQRVYEKLQPNTNVEIVPIFRDPDTMREKVADLNKNDAMFLFGHSGSRLGGIPNTEIANIFQESKAENCYLGSCDFEENVEPYTNMVNKNLNYRPSGAWWGVNPNGSTIDEAMWSRVTDPTTGNIDPTVKRTAKIITPTLGVDYQTKKLKTGGWLDKYENGGEVPKAQMGALKKLWKAYTKTPTLALPPRKGYGNANLDQVINTTANTLRNKGVGTDAYDVAEAIGHNVDNSGIPENVYRGVTMPLTEEGMSKLSNRRVMDYSQVGAQHLMTNNEGMLKMQEYAVAPDLARFQGISGNNIGNSNYMINAPWTSNKQGALPYATTRKKIVNNSDGSMSISNKEYQDEIGNLPQGMLQEFAVNKNKSLFGVNSGAIGSLSDLMSKKLGKPINQITLKESEEFARNWGIDYFKDKGFKGVPEYQFMPGKTTPTSSKFIFKEGGTIPKAQNGNFGGVNTDIRTTSGEPAYDDTVYPDDPNYDAKYKETYEGGAFASMPNQLDEVVLNSGVDYEKYPLYDDLSEQDRQYFKDDGAIGRGVRRRAQTKKGLAEDTYDVVNPLMYGMLGVAGGMMAGPSIANLTRAAAPYVVSTARTIGNSPVGVGIRKALNYKPMGGPASLGNMMDAGFADMALRDTPEMYDAFKENPNWDTGTDLALTASDLIPYGEIATGFKGTRRLINSAANKFNDLTSLKPNFTPFERVVENEAGRLKNLFNQPNIYPTSSPLPKRMEPYLSQREIPISKEEELLQSTFDWNDPEKLKHYNDELQSRLIRYNQKGEVIPNFKQGGVIKDDMGQWAHPGEVTEISGNTMATHGYGDNPLYVVPDVGEPRVVEANTGTQTFPGATKFTEYPMAKNGSSLVELNQLTNFTNYNTPQPGGWLDKYN